MTNTFTHTVTYHNPLIHTPQQFVRVRITREQRDAINAENAARYSTTYDGDLFSDMFS